MIISRAFDLVLDKAVRGYCPFIQVNTFFVSKEEAKYYRWSNGWEVGFHRLDFSGKSKDFINRADEAIPIGDLSIENTLVLLNGIVRQWERFEDEEEPSSVVCDVQYAGEINDSRLYIVPIGFKSQWDNTIMIHYLFKSFALIWHKLLPDIERKIKQFRGIHRRCGLNYHPWSSSW